MYGILSGLYKAITALSSSIFLGFAFIVNSFIPLDSIWKTKSVFPSHIMSYALESFSNTGLFISKSHSLNPASILASLTIFNVFTPRRSYLTTPISSTVLLSACITCSPLDPSFNPMYSFIFPSTIPTPPA